MKASRFVPFSFGGLSVLLTVPAAFGQCEQQLLQASDKGRFDAYGTSADVDGNFVVVGSPYSDQGGVDRGAAYVYELVGGIWTNEVKLAPNDVEDSKRFGVSVAISGSTIVVGAEWDSTNEGAAYIFEYDGTSWSQSAKLLSAIPWPDNNVFGRLVAIDSDTVVVSDPGSFYFGTSSGAVVVYEKPVTGWADTSSGAILSSTNTGNYDQFGTSIDIDGDEIVVGAQYDSVAGTRDGAAYVFKKPAAGWADMTQTATLTAASPTDHDFLGNAVAIDDGVVAAGAIGYDIGVQQEGAVYIYERGVGGWVDATEDQLLTASDPTTNAAFGTSLIMEGPRLVVGSGGSAQGTNSGSAYVWRWNGVSWWESQKIVSEHTFGYNSFSADLGLDGTTLVVGAPGFWSMSQGEGGAHLFDIDGFAFHTSSSSVVPGDTLSFDGCGGVPGSPMLLFLVAIDGNPFLWRIRLAPVQSFGLWNYTVTVPVTPGRPWTGDFILFGFSARTGGALEATNVAQVTFN